MISPRSMLLHPGRLRKFSSKHEQFIPNFMLSFERGMCFGGRMKSKERHLFPRPSTHWKNFSYKRNLHSSKWKRQSTKLQNLLYWCRLFYYETCRKISWRNYRKWQYFLYDILVRLTGFIRIKIKVHEIQFGAKQITACRILIARNRSRVVTVKS
jgi:hypothetical protein